MREKFTNLLLIFFLISTCVKAQIFQKERINTLLTVFTTLKAHALNNTENNNYHATEQYTNLCFALKKADNIYNSIKENKFIGVDEIRDNRGLINHSSFITSQEKNFITSNGNDKKSFYKVNHANAKTSQEIRKKNKERSWSFPPLLLLGLFLSITSYCIYVTQTHQLKLNDQLDREKLSNQVKSIEFENKINEVMLASLKAQINPHFIFNCLNSIKLYIEKSDNEAASFYLSKFSRLMRETLDIARSEKTSMAKEIELIETYLNMERMRFKGKLAFNITVDTTIDMSQIEFPPLLLQPYIENAIWHGLMPKPNGGMIDIRIKRTIDEKYILIIITDNGIGRVKARALKEKSNQIHTSHGNSINEERIALFNARFNANLEVMITDLYNGDQGEGTVVTIKFLYNEIFESNISRRRV